LTKYSQLGDSVLWAILTSLRDKEGEINMTRRRTFYVPVMIAAAVAVACLVVLLALSQKKAEAAFPGQNGRIAYEWGGVTDFEIYTIKAGGGGRVQLTDNTMDDFGPSWGSRP
jgi:hypothetical protein